MMAAGFVLMALGLAMILGLGAPYSHRSRFNPSPNGWDWIGFVMVLVGLGLWAIGGVILLWRYAP